MIVGADTYTIHLVFADFTAIDAEIGCKSEALARHAAEALLWSEKADYVVLRSSANEILWSHFK